MSARLRHLLLASTHLNTLCSFANPKPWAGSFLWKTLHWAKTLPAYLGSPRWVTTLPAASGVVNYTACHELESNSMPQMIDFITGDTALGYDTSSLQVVAQDFEAFVDKGGVVPDVVLVRKSYEVRTMMGGIRFCCKTDGAVCRMWCLCARAARHAHERPLPMKVVWYTCQACADDSGDGIECNRRVPGVRLVSREKVQGCLNIKVLSKGAHVHVRGECGELRVGIDTLLIGA
eukprot:scaffold91480_cov23-Tisochrysis_lutea.AAC.1